MKRNKKKTFLLILFICFALGIVYALIEMNIAAAILSAAMTLICYRSWKKQPNTVELKKSLSKLQEVHFNILSHDYENNIKSLIIGKNSQYEYSREEFIDSIHENECVYENDFDTSNPKLNYIPAKDSKSGKAEIHVYVNNILVGFVKYGAVSRVKGYMDRGELDHIYVELTGGKYKSYSLDENDKPEWDRGSNPYGADLYLYVKEKE